MLTELVEKLHFHHKEGIDKDQMCFMEELRNTTLDLKTRNPQSSGIKKFLSSGMRGITLYKIVDKVQELQNFGVQNLILMHHIPIDMLLCPNFITLFHMQKNRNIIF